VSIREKGNPAGGVQDPSFGLKSPAAAAITAQSVKNSYWLASAIFKTALDKFTINVYIIPSAILSGGDQMVEKTYLVFIPVSLSLLVLLLPLSTRGEESPVPTPASCPTCCERLKPYPDITADDLMKIKYHVKYTKFACDYRGYGYFKIGPVGGPIRSRYWSRYRIILNRESTEFDYKDLIILLGPQIMKGLSVLNWTYLDPDRDQEVWVWLPSLRKVRRMSQSEEADPFWGSDFTTEDVSTRKWEDETYKMVGEKKFSGHFSFFSEKMYYANARCYVVEGTPKRKEWYYSKRLMWLNKDFGGLMFDEVYDKHGKKRKTFLKTYEKRENGCLPQIFLEAEDQVTHHKTVIGFNKEDVIFNIGMREGFFSQKTLMRSKW
jgi:hypothetical protein